MMVKVVDEPPLILSFIFFNLKNKKTHDIRNNDAT